MSDLEKRLIAELNAVKEKHLAGRVEEAEKAYASLLTRYPNFIGPLHPHGIALQQLGRHADAVQTIGRWLAAVPDDVDAMVNMANSLTALGRVKEAVEVCRKAVALRPESQPARAALTQAEALSGQMPAAPAAPVSVEMLFAQANQVAEQGRSADAITLYQDILAINPNLPEVLVNLGNQLYKSQRAPEAISYFEKALKLRPGMREAYLNMGNALHEIGESERALDCFEKALKSDPTYRDALNNLANIHLNQGRSDKALTYARRLLKLYPEHIQAHGTAAGLMLARGEMKEGWEHYEWRWLKPGLPVPLRDFGCPEWTGEDISGKTILLSHEQGLGDSIQFVRFVPEVVKRAGHVILEVPANLMALYAPIPGVTLVAFTQPLPAYDVHLPLMSLPHVLGITLDNLPTPIPYLQAEPDRVEHWRDRLPQGGFRIGIVWQGKAGTAVDKGRSYALQHLAPVARIPGVTLISLQKGYGLDQLDTLPEGMQVVTLGPDFDEGGGAFLDTAAVMTHMDLIISSDTSVAHLAGALGRPVWVPLKLSPDWRWMLDREDCPWYPTMRLFRQRQVGDWPQVFDRVAAEVAALKGGDRSRLLPPPAPPAPAPAAYPPVPRPPLPAVREPALRQTQRHARPVGDGVMEVQARHGRLRYPADDLFIGRSLDAYGEWAEAENALCTPLLRSGDCVVEVGADIGCHTLALARAVGATGHVHAFEPREAANRLLTWNVQANDLPQVAVHRLAVGSSQEPGEGGEAPVARVTIDSLTLDRLRLLKAKADDGGLDLLRGAEATIGRCRPILYLGQQGAGPSMELIALLRQHGYSLWSHKYSVFRPNNDRNNNVDIFQGVHFVNLLCVPAERDAVIVGLEPVPV